MYDPDDFDVKLPYSAHRNPNPILEHIRKMRENGETAPLLQTAFYADDRQIREAMALAAGMIDDQIGNSCATDTGLVHRKALAYAYRQSLSGMVMDRPLRARIKTDRAFP